MKDQALMMGAAVLLAVSAPGVVGAQVAQTLDRVDQLHWDDRHDQAIVLLEQALRRTSGATAEAEVRWRLARAVFNRADLALYAGTMDEETALAELESGRDHGERAIELDPTEPEGYFWTAANMGKWGELRGVIRSLFLADDLEELLKESARRGPENGQPFYVLGRVYREVPGSPLSFGDDDKAVNVGRLAVDLNRKRVEAGIVPEPFAAYRTDLARNLWERNWSAGRRRREAAEKREELDPSLGPVERAFLYEATIDIPDVDDRQEARDMLQGVIADLRSIAEPDTRDRRDLDEALATLEEW